MLFGHVEIPANLINSLKENKVIVFAGAGVSMGEPANLPDFANLTRQILNLDENEKFDNPDQKLGEGFDQGVRIHEQCVRILKKDLPQHTLLHSEILRLFPKIPRVITTNFDLLFEQAFKNNYPTEEVKIFNAPVFPLGNNIEGIIYLHGNITDPRSMVLSDADFGRAYLSESWAKRLLSDAFLNYDFIFIGYSYNDTILKYLTRALPKNRASKLYAFANIEDGNIQQINHWKSLGIEPLIYTKENGSHQQLPQAVEKLAQFLNFNFYEYENLFTSKIKEYENHQTEESLNYVKFFLSSDGYKQFYKVCDAGIWLKKFKDDQSLFEKLIKHEPDFFQWFVDFLGVHDDALMNLCNQYSQLKNNQNLLWKIFRKLDDSQNKNCYLKWFLFLEKYLYLQDNSYNGVHSWVCKKLIGFSFFREFERAFDAFLSIQIQPEIQFYISEYDLESIIDDVKKNSLFHDKTIQILINKIEEYDTVLKLYDKQKIQTSWEKQEIWDRDKSYSKELDYNLVDSIIDLFSEKKLSKDFSDRISKQCLSSESIILQRLGIYVFSRFSSYDSDLIYSLIDLKTDWLNTEFKAEIFKFLELRYEKLSYQRRYEIIFKIKNTPDLSNHARLKWFAWIYKFSPKCKLVNKEYSQLKLLLPDFELEDKPYLSWHSSGVYSVTDISPFSVNEIQARNDYIWYLALLEYDFYQHSFNNGYDLGYVGLWHEIEKANPLWLLDFIDFAIRTMPEHHIIERVITKAGAWEFNSTIHEKFFTICQVLTIIKNYKLLYTISKFIYYLNSIDFYRENLDKYQDWIEISERIVDLNRGQKSFESGDVDELIISIESINGLLAEFIIQLYALSTQEKEIQKKCQEFIRFLIKNDIKGYAVINLMNRYSFFKKSDSLFAQKELLPFLFSNQQEVKLQAWRGFFRNAHLEFAEFREIYRELFNILQYALDHNDIQIVRSLIDLYIFSIYLEYHDDAIKSLRKLQRFDHQEINVQILQTVQRILKNEPDIEKVWAWFGEYIQDRLYQVNQPLTAQEISKIWYFLTYHPDMIVKLKDIVLQLPFNDEWIRFIKDLSRNDILAHHTLWCEVLGFYFDNQDDRVAVFIYESDRILLKSLVDYDDKDLLQNALLKKGIKI